VWDLLCGIPLFSKKASISWRRLISAAVASRSRRCVKIGIDVMPNRMPLCLASP
jgi:hypothetical protein